jgi:hypothetical protein
VRIELPNGGWAVLADPREVPERKRRRYIAAMADLSAKSSQLPQKVSVQPDGTTLQEPDTRFLAGEYMQLNDLVSDALVLCLVQEWSFGPVDDATLLELAAGSMDVLLRRCRELQQGLVPDYSPDIDPKAPTSASTVSPALSPAVAATSVNRSYVPTS